MEENKMETIRFRNLSGWLKFAIILSWIMGSIYALAFIIGFAEGIAGAI